MEKVKIRLHEIAGLIAVTTLLVVLFFSMTAHAADGSGTYTDGYGVTWKYSVSDQEVSILGCDNIPESGELHIPAAIDGAPVKMIESHAFQNNESVRKVTFPDSLTTIFGNAFYGCTNLETVNITAGITRIDGNVFSRCSSLREVTVDSGNASFKAVDGVLFSKAGDTLIFYPIAKSGDSYTVPDGVSDIGDYSFYGAGITSVTIPASVRTISNGAFYYCESLRRVTFAGETQAESALETIESNAFSHCTSLRTIDLPASVRSIGDNSFGYSSSLTVVNLPDGLSSMGTGAFQKTGIDQNFRLPPGIKTIPLAAFEYCLKLQHFVVPDTVEKIENRAFGDCLNIKDVFIASDTTEIDGGAFSGCGQYDTGIQRRRFALSGSADSAAAQYAAASGTPFSALTESEYLESIASDKPVYNFDDELTGQGSGTGGSGDTNASSNQAGDKKTGSDYFDSGKSGKSSGIISAPAGTVKKTSGLGKPSFKAKNKKGKKVKLSWKKVKKAKGYFIYVKGPGDRKFVRRAAVSARVKSITHMGLVKGKKYRYKIAAFKVVKGVRKRGPFSRTITVKVKK